MQKSSVTVCIRARPLFSHETSDAFGYSPTAVNLISSGSKSPMTFSYDHVFSSSASTEDVFDKVARPMISSVLEGYNATMFAYGQTTSGKTHTMVGTAELPGMIPLTVEELFRFIDKSDRVYRVWVSYLEIYNEVANDLLQPRSINLKLRENPSEGCYVLGLKQVRVYNSPDVMQVLEIGERNKHYRETKIHDHSSRSHTVFKMIIDSSERGRLDLEDDEETRKPSGMKSSIFNLVDLAGSERLNESGSSSITETAHINKSLFVLTKVINKLADGPGGHVPYRDSKLTRILSTALGGNSLTTIICTIAPAAVNVQLSLSTLRFASRAKSIVNKPVINEILDDSELIESLKAQIRRLEKSLADREALCRLDHSQLLAENQELKARLQVKEEHTKVLHEVKFLNVEVSDLIAKHEELRRNFDIQLTLRTELLRENSELKNRGIIGFDIQKQRVEAEKREIIAKVREDWHQFTAHLRNEYIMELSALDELFYEQMHTFIDSQRPALEQKENVFIPPLASRPRSRQQRKTIEVPKLLDGPKNTPAKPPHKPGTSLKTIRSMMTGARALESQNSDTRPRSSSKKSIVPVRALPLSPQPPLPKRKYLSLESDSEDDSGFSDGETANPHSVVAGSQIDDEEAEEQRPDYLPLPIEEECKESVGSVAIDPCPGSNVLLYGMNKDGCCGVSSTSLQCTKPSAISPEFITISLGSSFTAGIDHSGVLYTFGRGRSGQLGQGTLSSCIIPQPVTHPLYAVPVKKVSCGADHTLCVTQEGQVYAWGSNEDGQLGIGDQYDRMRPYKVTYLDMKVRDVATGYYHSAAITDDGFLYTWGANPDGRLFRPPIRIRYQKFKVDTVPTKVHDFESVVSIHLGKSHSILMSAQGEVYTAGSNSHGELGTNPTVPVETAFIKVNFFTHLMKAKSVACGDSFSVVLTQKGGVYTFGKGGDGRLGLGDNRDRYSPQPVSSSLRFKKVACGARHVLALCEDDEVYSWGCGIHSQLCNESEEDQLVPTMVDLSTKTGLWARELVCGHFHSAVITM